MDKVYKPSNSECYTTSSESFRFYLNVTFVCGVEIMDRMTMYENDILHCKYSTNALCLFFYL
jgi:hypothetical protein